MTEKEPDKDTRLGSMLLDHFIMTAIVSIFILPKIIESFSTIMTHEQPKSDVFGGMSYFLLIGFALYFCKDSIHGRSIAKQIFKLQLVDNTTGQVASPLKCLIRNVFCIIWPLEVIVAYKNPGRRIGDLVAGTRLEKYDPALEQPTLNIGKVGVSLLLAYGCLSILMFTFSSMQPDFGIWDTKFVESSYNVRLSKSCEKLFNDSLGQILTADIQVYDKIENEDLKYVSAIFMLKRDELTFHSNFEKLNTQAKRILLTRFPEKTFVGELKYVYKSGTNMSSTTIYLDWRTRNIGKNVQKHTVINKMRLLGL